MSSPSYVTDDAENVLDHGGELGSGVSRTQAEDNAAAIESASNASSGGNVYIPEGEFRIAAQYSVGTVIFDGQQGAAGASVYGAGPTLTFLTVHPDHADDEMTEVWYNGGDHGEVTWRGLTYDGNETLDSFTIGEGRQRGIVFRDGNSASGLTFRDFRMQHMMFNGIHIGSDYPPVSGTFDRCTFYDIAIDLMEHSDGDNVAHALSGTGFVRSGEKMRIEDSEFRMVSGSIVDMNSPGDIEFYNCYAAGIGDTLMKAGDSFDTLTVRHFYHQGTTPELAEANEGLSTTFQGRHLFNRLNPGSGDQTIELSHVEARNLVTSVANAGDGEFTIQTHADGGPVACHDIATESSAEFSWVPFRSNNGDIAFDIDRISVHNVGDDVFDLNSGSGSMATLRRDSDSAIGATDGVSFGTDDVGANPFEPDVPSQDEVGITASSDSSDTDSGSSDPVFDEWTPRWNSSQDDWSVASDPEFDGESALVFEHDADERSLYGISWDAVGEHSDVEVLDRFRVPAFNPEDGLGFHARVHLRSSTVDGTRQGYWIEIEDRQDAYRLGRYTADGDLTTLGHFGTPVEDQFTNRRFRAEGNVLKAKVWPASESEPADWDIEVTDDAVSSGWVGLGSYDPGRVETDFFSVATGGDTAQFMNTDTAPSASWVEPTADATLSGAVTLQISAGDAEDSEGSLDVRYSVDGGSSRSTTYNADTGYYEDSWDTSVLADGDHTLDATATDSAGNTTSSSITVRTDNSGGAPTVDSLSLSEVETSDGDAEFDAVWQVSDADGDLDSVEVTLTDDTDGETEDSATVGVSGDGASDTTRLIAAGDDGTSNDYRVELVVTDTEGNTASTTASATETEDDGTAPAVNNLSVSEAGRPDPHAEVTVVWDVSDADGDLASVHIEVADSSGSVQSVTWSVAGSNASDTDDFKIKDGDGSTFDVTLTVTDSAGHSTSETTSVTA